MERRLDDFGCPILNEFEVEPFSFEAKIDYLGNKKQVKFDFLKGYVRLVDKPVEHGSSILKKELQLVCYSDVDFCSYIPCMLGEKVDVQVMITSIGAGNTYKVDVQTLFWWVCKQINKKTMVESIFFIDSFYLRRFFK